MSSAGVREGLGDREEKVRAESEGEEGEVLVYAIHSCSSYSGDFTPE